MSSRAQAHLPAAGMPADWFQAAGKGSPGREQVSEIQRRRMLAAMMEVASELGAGNVTVAHVVGRSGVSRRTFYEIFEDREECFLAAFDGAVEEVAQRVVPAYRAQREWSEGMRAGLTALLELLEADPCRGRLLIVEALGAGPRALERRRRVLDALSRTVEEAVMEAKGGQEPPPLIAEGVVGAVLSVLHARLSSTEQDGVRDLVNPLMSMIVSPYEGRAAAERELSKQSLVKHEVGAKRPVDPLRDLGMRLTHRTICVLMAVAANPGGSNRMVANAAGINDQGQISKLLARLQGLGLIENTGAESARGEPNAWVLTAKGWDVHGAISAHTTSS